MNDPAIAVVETKAVAGGCERTQLDDGLAVIDQKMLNDKPSTFRENLVQFVKSAGNKLRFGLIMAGQRMSPFDNPLDPGVNMLKEVGTAAGLKPFKQLADVLLIYSHWKSLSARGSSARFTSVYRVKQHCPLFGLSPQTDRNIRAH
jgi:hypothetical protein